MIILNKKKYTIYISEKKDGTAREIPEFIYTKQVHGNDIHILDQYIDFINSDNDGILSEIPNARIWVLLADCNGIIVMGNTWYGVIHAGRRWLQNSIIEKALAMLHKKWEELDWLQVYIWPSIRKCCYEVGDEFLWYFDKKYLNKREWKLYFDMIAHIHDTLIQAWIHKQNIEIHSDCTACSDKFFSYRKQNNNQRIVVGIKKQSI